MGRRRSNKRRRDKQQRQQRSIENPAVPLSSSLILQYLEGGSKANSGIVVNWKTALKTSPVWQAVDILTGDLSRTPFITYKDDDGSRRRATEHSVFRLLRRYTGEMTSDLWLSRMLGHALLYGNGYSRVIWRGSTVVGLEWLHRDDVICEYERGVKYYLVRYDEERHGRGTVERVPAEDMLHLIGLTLDEFGGLSLVDFARNTIGRNLAAENWADDFFNNYGVPMGYFEHPGEMSEPAQNRFLERMTARHSGPGKGWRPGILEEGMTWKTAGVDPTDALLIDAMKWGTKDVARFFNLPAHKLGDDSRVSYNSLEQEEKAYQSTSLGKWFSRLEFACNHTLFLDDEQAAGYYCEFLQDNLGKADTLTRFQAYSIAVTNGFMNRTEVRARENLPPYEGSDEFLVPLTHQQGPAPDADEPAADVEPAATTPTRSERAIVHLFDLVRDRLQDAGRLLANAANKASRQDSNFLAQINGFDARFRPAITGKIRPAVAAATESSDEARTTAIASAIIEAAIETYVNASECRREELRDRVLAAGEHLSDRINSLAEELCFGDERDARETSEATAA